MENLQTGLLLMAVGMTTVFLILLILIYLSQGLIALVNKIAPEEEVKSKPIASPAAGGSIPSSTLAAISAAVSMVTGGKGKVIKVEKK